MDDALGAVLSAPGEPVEVVAIELEEPGPQDVLVRIGASGVCHTDLHVKNLGGMGLEFPILLGHEGAGVIEAIGQEVRDLEPGDRVVLGNRVPCGHCSACLRGEVRRCKTDPPPSGRMRRASDGAPLSQVLPAGTLATHTIVPAAVAVKIPDAIPLSSACLIGCGVSTGVGAALNLSPPVWEGASVAVIGCGAVGLSIVQGARLARAERIVAVDVRSEKLAWAERFGATDLVDAGREDAVARVRELTGGAGVDFAFEAVGLPDCVDSALGMLCYGGVATHAGVADRGTDLRIDLGEFGWENRTLRACDGGETLPRVDFPMLAALYLEGSLNLDDMVTRQIGLDEVEDAFLAMGAGEVIRSVVVFD